MGGLCSALIGAHLPWVKNAAKSVFAIEPLGDCIVWGFDKVCGEIYLESRDLPKAKSICVKTMSIANSITE